MKIAHIALWTRDLDRLCGFWAETFGAVIGELYESRRRPGFSSRFLRLSDGAEIEIMQGPWIAEAGQELKERPGYAHLALSLGGTSAVDAMAAQARERGILVSPARMTGDGFYEAVLRDPDGNLIEITA